MANHAFAAIGQDCGNEMLAARSWYPWVLCRQIINGERAVTSTLADQAQSRVSGLGLGYSEYHLCRFCQSVILESRPTTPVRL
jgi:hypothetical protein